MQTAAATAAGSSAAAVAAGSPAAAVAAGSPAAAAAAQGEMQMNTVADPFELALIFRAAAAGSAAQVLLRAPGLQKNKKSRRARS